MCLNRHIHVHVDVINVRARMCTRTCMCVGGWLKRMHIHKVIYTDLVWYSPPPLMDHFVYEMIQEWRWRVPHYIQILQKSHDCLIRERFHMINAENDIEISIFFL
jgi:hypothetical protein